LGKNFVSLMELVGSLIVDELFGWLVVVGADESLPDTTFDQLEVSPERSALDADLVLEGDMRFTSGSESTLLSSTPTFRRGEDAGGAPTLRSSICRSLSTFALGENNRVGSGSGGIGLLVTCGTLVPSSMGRVAMLVVPIWRFLLVLFFLGLIQPRVFIDQ
jgi:hypothetical protein